MATKSMTDGFPVVSVPVLSNTTTPTCRIRSSASRSLTKMPLRAAREVEIEITRGMASPRAWGQAITRTVTVRSIALLWSPSSDHTM